MSDHDFSVDCDVKGEKRQLVGKAGDFDVYAYQRAKARGGQYSATRRIPTILPASRFVWDRNRPISTIPSVTARDIQSGPCRTLSPSKISLHSDVMPRSTSEAQKVQKAPSEIWSRGTERGRKDALRDSQFAFQQYLKDRPLLCAMRRRINQAVSRR